MPLPVKVRPQQEGMVDRGRWLGWVSKVKRRNDGWGMGMVE